MNFPSGVLTFIGSVFSGLVILTLWIWRHTTSLDGEDEDRIRELENNQESRYKAELGELYLEIEELVSDDEPVPEDMPRDELVVNAIERGIDENDMDEVVEQLDEIGEAEELWDAHRHHYRKAYQKFGTASMIVLAIAIIMAAASITSGAPFSSVASGIYAVLSVISANYAWDGIGYFTSARDCKEEFEERWREYRRID